jgi:non-homologous end joining protein Ku
MGTMKAIANTTIRLGLINLPVQVCSAEESGTDIRFNMAGPNGEQLEQRYCVKGTTTLVAKDDIQKGIFEDGDCHRGD